MHRGTCCCTWVRTFDCRLGMIALRRSRSTAIKRRLPSKTELNEDALDKPREVFRSEVAGGKSYLVNLGNLAFGSPSILGDVARQAGMSCGTCHVNGAGNAKFFMPKMSTRPGNFDTTGPLFNPKANNFVLDPVRIPSLRGARYLAPYGARWPHALAARLRSQRHRQRIRRSRAVAGHCRRHRRLYPGYRLFAQS